VVNLTNTLESMKGPIVVVSLIVVFGLAVAFGQNMSDADKLVGFVITGLVAVGYITTHQQKALLAAQGAIQPILSEVVSDIQGMEPEARVIVAKLEQGKAPTAQEIADLYPDVEELIGDLQKLVPATQMAISDTAEAK
jgi:Skp family chaperone for outer membrane proteins